LVFGVWVGFDLPKIQNPVLSQVPVIKSKNRKVGMSEYRYFKQGIENMKNNKKVSIVLGGGTAYGFAHGGFLKAYEDVMQTRGYKLDELAGCSMGAVFACLYSHFDLKSKKLIDFASSITRVKMLELADPDPLFRSIIKGNHIYAFLKEIFGNKTLNQLPMPVRVMAAKKEDHSQVVLEQDFKIVDALMASVAVKPLFKDWNGLIDGGYYSIVPIELVKSSNIIVVSNVFYMPAFRKKHFIFNGDTLFTNVRNFQLARRDTMKADLGVEYNFGNRMLFDFFASKWFIKCGYKWAFKSMKEYCKGEEKHAS